jgi:uncharacterized membrane protein (DUF4010 family)
VAGLIGLATGIEREWSGHTRGPDARFAGARTFLMLGLVGGVAGLLLGRGFGVAAALLLAGPAALAVTAFAVAARRTPGGTLDGTTEMAALLVLALGTTAGLGLVRLAAAVGALMVLALREKSAIQRFVGRIDELELRGGFQFAVLALVLLPLLPEGPYGPLGGVRPRELWIVVLVVSALNFAGYLARRVHGPLSGTVLTGLVGGLFSSTAVTLAMSRRSRDGSEGQAALSRAVMAACLMLLPRLMAVTLVLQPSLTLRLFPFLFPQLLIASAAVLWAIRNPVASDPPGQASRNPLRLGSALALALGFQAVLMAMALAHSRFGGAGILTSAALVGVTDMDALALAMSRLASGPDLVTLAATAVAIGLLANTGLKLALVMIVGSGRFRRETGLWLLALIAGSALGLRLGTL